MLLSMMRIFLMERKNNMLYSIVIKVTIKADSDDEAQRIADTILNYNPEVMLTTDIQVKEEE